MPPRKAAATVPITESLAEDVELTTEEQGELAAEEAGTETPVETPKGGKEKPHEESIPYDRFKQLDDRYKESQGQVQQLQEYRERWARLEERQRVAAETQQRELQRAEQERMARLRPDPDIDPTGARLWESQREIERLQSAFNQMAQQLQTGQQQAAQNMQDQQLNNWVTGQIGLARMRVPNYDAQVDFARTARVNFWSQFYPQQQAMQIVENEERALLNRARDVGMSLADVVPQLAKTWGYQTPAANGNGVRQAAQPDALPSGNQRLQQIQAGQAVQGLGRVQSGESNAQLPWQQMSIDEFKLFVGGMSEEDYIDAVHDPRTGKQFEKKVSLIDLADAG